MKIIGKSKNADKLIKSLNTLSSGMKSYEEVKNKNLTFKTFYDLHQTIQNIDWEKLDLKNDDE
jgi:hypothetical protein